MADPTAMKQLKREGAAIRALLDRADGIELSAEVALEKARIDADEMRWEAAERYTKAFAVAAVNKAQFAKTMGVNSALGSRLLRVWEAWSAVDGERPRFYDAAEMLADESVAERATSRGRSITGQAADERRAAALLKSDDTARAIMRNPTVRESARHAIIAAEAEEARQRLMAGAKSVDLPLPRTGFSWLEAGDHLNRARKLINGVTRTVKEHTPLSDRDRESMTDEIRDVRVALEILETVLNMGDLDEAFARLLNEEG